MSVDSAVHTLSSYQLAILAVGSIAFGLFLLFKAGGWTVGAAIYLAQRLGLSQLFIGATVVAFGTSVPELVTSVNANLSGYPGLSLGNVIGSNIANILLVTGATAAVFALVARPRNLVKDAVMVCLATGVLIALMMTGEIERWHGLALFAVLLAYVAFAFVSERRGGAEPELEEEELHVSTTWQALLFLGGGLLGLIVGSEILVQGAVAAGTALRVPEAVIGVTVVALGTSLPELATCLVAALRRKVDMVVGNILGSNLFNILSIIGLTALVKPLPVEQDMFAIDMWVMAGTTLVFALWMVTVARLGRALGIAMMLAYLVFTLWQYRDAMLH